MRTQPIPLNPDDELACRLRQESGQPVIVEANGVRYRVVRQAGDIWTDYDPERAVKAVERSAGILKRSGVNVEELLTETSDDRSQHSRGHPDE